MSHGFVLQDGSLKDSILQVSLKTNRYLKQPYWRPICVVEGEEPPAKPEGIFYPQQAAAGVMQSLLIFVCQERRVHPEGLLLLGSGLFLCDFFGSCFFSCCFFWFCSHKFIFD
jgi:hypothetical protein